MIQDQYSYKNPKVVCGCPTFGRPMRLINETVKSFLLQDYPNKELIVYNDCDLVQLKCNAQGVTIINRSERHRSLGEKFNALMEIGDYDLWLYWNDDDIYLPWAISTYVNNIVDGFYVPSGRWFMLHDEIVRFTPAALANPWMCTKSLWQELNGYITHKMGIDYNFCGRARNLFPESWTSKLTREETFFIYRWGTGSYHASSNRDPDHYDKIGKKVRETITPGTQEIQPVWKNDYVKMTKEFIICNPS